MMEFIQVYNKRTKCVQYPLRIVMLLGFELLKTGQTNIHLCELGFLLLNQFQPFVMFFLNKLK